MGVQWLLVVAAPAADTVHVSRCWLAAVVQLHRWSRRGLPPFSHQVIGRSCLPAEAPVVCMHVHSTLLQYVSGKQADGSASTSV